MDPTTIFYTAVAHLIIMVSSFPAVHIGKNISVSMIRGVYRESMERSVEDFVSLELV